MLKFDFTNESGIEVKKIIFVKRVKALEKVLGKKLKGILGKRAGRIDLILVTDPVIQVLNKKYRHKNKPTDVISFGYLEVTDFDKHKGDIIIGDVFISVDTAIKQALLKGHSFECEMEILFVHGMLHCLGFDHETDEEEAEMEGWARKVLRD